MITDATQNVISFVAHGARVDVHRHYCFQMIVSIRSTFDCVIGGVAYQEKTGFIINQNVPHSCVAERASVLIYFIDAESYFGWQLKELLAGEAVLDIEPFFTAEQQHRYRVEDNQTLSKVRLQQMASEIFAVMLPPVSQPTPPFLDERIAQAIHFIEQHIQSNPSLEMIADLVCLSPERTRHLFAQATGVPFSQFLLWKRLKQVILFTVRDGLSLTTAAVEAGFADQAHFCRTFKRMFGISAKGLLKNSRSVQFLNPLT
ncbi:MAG: AraC family transcriptional regulator [Caldilinea sp. CFX5]|nr:AraC family transcriptional regulator [Caldilinea sp. CFX5]